VKFFIVLVTLVLILFIPQALGHVPVIAGSNENPSSATYIPDITKSWAIYGHLQDKPQYISFDAKRGQIIYAPLLIPTGPVLGALSQRWPLYFQEGQHRPRALQGLTSRPRWPMNATYEAFGPNSFYRGSRKSTSLPRSQVGITWRSLVMAAEVTA
jgi:hypothetical protein